ncbi:hypothetical protein [Streptomyces sp. NBC_00572]|uniref:hypothetical protein n=1 Tax=Streptomyces sp. NBC_00572 TaxID=2903664 RepID=UPI002255E6C2|nr:hypothetical protein [Streptomyces sp. NBC_00572]MCX4985965.1 hypothetical protein [Streptomyces sp. NBC_00572]
MTLWQLTAHGVRAYWRLACIPIGILVNAYGNTLTEGSDRTPGLVLFLVGGGLAISGLTPLKRFLEESPLRDGLVKIVAALSVMALFTLGTLVAVGIKVAKGTAQPLDYSPAAASLALIYIGLPLTMRWMEPKDFLLQRLPGRVRRAATSRTIANAAGILAIASFLNARFSAAYPAPLLSIALTLLVAMAVVTHKTFARTRKLCTQIHTDVQSLLRDLDALDQARSPQRADDKQADKRMAARRSWDALKRDLSTTVDTGYRTIGLPFLADEAVAELGRKVLAEIEAGCPGGGGRVRVDLQAIQDACARHIDVLA